MESCLVCTSFLLELAALSCRKKKAEAKLRACVDDTESEAERERVEERERASKQTSE